MDWPSAPSLGLFVAPLRARSTECEQGMFTPMSCVEIGPYKTSEKWNLRTKIPYPEAPGAFNGRPDPTKTRSQNLAVCALRGTLLACYWVGSLDFNFLGK